MEISGIELAGVAAGKYQLTTTTSSTTASITPKLLGVAGTARAARENPNGSRRIGSAGHDGERGEEHSDRHNRHTGGIWCNAGRNPSSCTV